MNTEIKKDKIEPGETVSGVLICPFGDWPKGDQVQRCDSKAFTQLVANWDAAGQHEILCDFEHASEVDRIDSDTRAAAWISNLQVTDEGLVGDMKFTDIGADAVSNRRLRFLSPVWEYDDDIRPTVLKSVALTNKPNIPGKCILNKEDPEPVTTKKEKPHMDKIKAALGLAPEASDEEVAAKVAELVAANEALNKEKEEAENAAKDAEAEAFAEEHKDIANKEDIKASYLANKDATVKLFAGLKKPAEAPQQILNKAGCKEPTLKNKATREALASLPPSQRAAFYREHAAEIDG